ncbi:unnamed protein product [Ectocarpus sp. CCAP 1310/34]|nr:unnamed protein product [Ectocarpus sp. CCAP 1310/34]
MTSGTSNYSTPAPTATGTFTTPTPTAIGTFTTPDPTAIGNFTTPAPTAIGTFTTPDPTAIGNSTTPAPTAIGTFTTPDPSAIGNVTTPAPTAIGNFTITTPAPTAIGTFTTPDPTAIGNFTTPAPTAIGTFTTPDPTAIGNSTTPAPTAIGTFTTPDPSAIGNVTTPAPTAIGNFTITTPAPTAIGTFTTPDPTAIGNFTTPAPTAIGTFTTPDPTAIGNSTTPAPTLAGNFSTPSPTVVGNFSAGNSTTGNFTSGNVSMGGDEAMGVVSVSIAGSATLVQTPAPAGQAPESESGRSKYTPRSVALVPKQTLFNVSKAGAGVLIVMSSTFLWIGDLQDPTKMLNITGCLFSENTIDGGDEGTGEDGEVFGGTVVAKWGVVTIDDTMFYNNKGLLVEGANLTVTNTQFNYNTASQYGGGILQVEAGFMDIQNSIFDGNVADYGGGALAVATASRADRYNLDNCLFIFNVAGNDGGGVLYLLSMESSDLTGIVTFTRSDEAASIQVTLHYNASVVPSDVISTLANKVALSTSPESLNAESSVAISPPENPPKPQLVPEVWYTALAHCKDLVLDVSASTGGGGRVMESYQWELYDWAVEQESDAPSAEFDYAEEASAAGGSSKLTIPGAGRKSENELTWYFNITATNWLGGIGWTSVEVVLRAASLAIVAYAEVENCVTNKTSGLTYEWSELRTGETAAASPTITCGMPFFVVLSFLTAQDPSMFKLPSHSLEIGVEYEFRVDVTDSVGYSSFATQVVTVESSSLIAAVAGGNSTVSAGIDLVLDMTATIDPDEVNADTVVAIEAKITLSEDSSAIAEWTLTDGVLNDFDELRLAASSSLEYAGYGSNSTLIASVYALDALGAASRATFGVTVSAYEGGIEELSALVEAVATEALAAGDTDTVMQVLDVASSSLNAANCTVAPDCAALNRDDCGTDGLREENTCGECVSGFVGVVGPHNSLCVDTTAFDASCSDGEKNGDETDVDCGGPSCSPCPSGSTCLVGTDCSYNNCPEPASTTSDPICVPPAKACPNDCGGTVRGTCEYVSSTSGAALNAADCLADTPTSTCRATCNCFDGYGGDGCQYSDSELEAAVETREQSLLYIQESAERLDISRDTISRQAVLLSKLSVIPQEMKASSATLVLDLATETTHMADESGEGVASTAAFAVVEIIGQVTLASSFLEEESNMEGLSDVVGSLISSQVAGKVVGEVADEVSSDYFRLSTGIYDAATVGEISPPLTADDESVGRSVSSIGLPGDVGDAFSDVSSMSLAVAEWIIDPRQGSEESSSAENCQVDFASTFLDTAGEFISIWDEATTLTWTEVQSAAPIFATMGGILALAVISAGFGWRLDQKDRGRPAGCGAWLASLACWSKAPPPTTDNQGKALNERRASTLRVPKRGMTRDECLKSLAAAVRGDNKDNVDATAPHHLGERRVRKSLKLLIMIHHDFVSVFYCFYEWFTRPQRVALLLCSVVTLMATEATVFASIMFKDDGTCGAFENLADCAASSTANVNVAGVGSSCAWDEGSRTCYLPEPEEDMETSLVISTISLILALPLELFLVAVFAAFLVRPTKTNGDRAGTGDMEAERWELREELVAVTLLGARLTIEVDLARAAEHRREGKMTRFWRSLCCGCGFCGDGAKREARLQKKVKRSLGAAITLEKKIAQTGDVDSKEALLFEQAEADSLNYLERQVFFNSRILNYGEEDSQSGVPLCIKCLAWLFIVMYAVGLSFYVCLFAVKAGRATSVQWMISFWVAFAEVARRHPNMEVSGLILQGRIPNGNEFEKFIPLFTARSRWYTCMTGLVFTVLAIIMLLPDTLQAMMKKEKKLRKARVTQGGYSSGNGTFSGVNVLARGRTAGGRTPNFNTPSPGLNIVAGNAGFQSDQRSPTMNTASLARWVSAVKPGSVQRPQVDQQTKSPPRPPRANHGRTNSLASIGMISEAGSRWDHHGRLDSCAASAWGEVHVSDVESSVNEGGGNGDDESSVGTGPRLHGRDHSGGSWNLQQNEWDGLGNTLSLQNSVDLGTTASFTFFDDLGDPSHRANVHSRSLRGNSYEDDEESKSPERSPGSIAVVRAAGRTSSSSRFDDSRRQVQAAAHGDCDGDASPKSN